MVFMENSFDLLFIYVVDYCVGPAKTTLIFVPEGLVPYFSRRKLEKTRSMEEEMDREVFVSRQSRFFILIDKMVEVLFPICTSIGRVNNYVSRQGKGINRRSESTVIIIWTCSLLVLYLLLKSLIFMSSFKPLPHNKRRSTLVLYKWNLNSVFTADRTFPSVSWQLWEIGEN